ncbi:N-acetylglucosamine kinase [Orbus mooreae]|uniref:N-acetylglucosamine kinase n=1 Tax=Orbus mooreae TaxID=3074107 RepID=UPI00370DCD19
MLYGFDIGGTKIEIAVFDEHFQQIWCKRVPTPQDSYEAFLASVVSLVEEADNKFNTLGQIGIGMPGMIDHKNRTIYTTNINVVKNKPFIDDIETKLGRPIAINNDANCFALSEALDDEYHNYHNVISVILGTGLGGGIVINRQVISGANGCTGEIGHIRLPVDMFTILGHDIPLIECGCGQKGCCERYLSGTGFEWLYQHFYHESLSAKVIINNYNAGDERANEHVERYLELLAAYFGNLMMIVDAELIVIGGGLSNFEQIYQQVPQRMAKYLLKQMRVPHIAKAKYGDSGGARGAALLSLNTIL